MSLVSTYELEIQQWWANVCVDEELLNTRLVMQYRLDSLAYQLCVMHQVPSKVLQRDEVVATWPATRWDNFLVAIGLKSKATYKALKFTEMLTFPGIEVPPSMRSGMRIHTYTTTELLK